MKDGETPPTRPVDPATVTNIATGTDTIDFDVDHVGTPVLVKASYFPNWKVDGAQGPFRVTPNLMVVIPTSTHVHLHYGNTGVEYIAYLLTLHRHRARHLPRSPSAPCGCPSRCRPGATC